MDDYLDSPMEEDVFPCKGCGEVRNSHPGSSLVRCVLLATDRGLTLQR